MTSRDILMLMAGLLPALTAVGVYFLIRSRYRARRFLRAGKEGEKIIARKLKRLARRSLTDLLRGRRSCVVFNDLLVGDSSRTLQVDHLVVCRRGIFVIETKSHIGRITGTEFGQYWTQRREMQTRSFYNPLLQNDAHVRRLSSMIKGTDPEIWHSVILFTRAWEVDIRAEDIVEAGRFWGERHIARTFDPSVARPRRWWRRGKEIICDPQKKVILADGLKKVIRTGRKVLGYGEIADLAARIRSLNIEGSRERREHAGYAGKVGERVRSEISSGTCPRCGGRLRVVEGVSGKFIGCTNYPGCRFTAPYDIKLP